MAPVSNARFIFNDVPKGLPVPGQTTIHDESQVIDVETADLKGGFLVKVLAVSLDPYMRNRMRSEDVPGDMPAFRLGGVIDGFCVGVVLRSEANTIRTGEHVYGFMPFQNYNVFPSMDSNTEGLRALGLSVIQNPFNLPWRYFVGILGMTGQTAYYGLKDMSSPKKGETIFVSAASGAVGSVVVQLAKRLGLKVIGSAGSEEKVQLVKSLGADHVFNYKTSSVRDELKKHGPIDIYFDNVGGETLEAAIENAAQRARFVICGAVSTYNQDMSEAYGVKNLWLLSRYRIKMEGLVVIDWHEKYAQEFYETMPKLVASGEIKCLEHVYEGLEKAGQALQDVLTGENRGKAVVEIAE